MRRVSVALGILGLVWAATLPAGAQTQVKLFGKTYNVEIATRAQTYKTADGREVTIKLTAKEDAFGEWTQKAALYFVEGADPSQDRLFVACHLDSDTDGPEWHQLYMLRGADANGNFTPASATLTEFFGGPGNRFAGGRPLSIMLINDEDTRVKQDRNVVMMQWTNSNGYRLYDLDSMKSRDYHDEELFFGISSSMEAEERYADKVYDVNAPFGNWIFFAPAPTDDKRTVVAIGEGEEGGVDCSVWDTKTDTFYPVLTNLSIKTASANIPIPDDHRGHGLIRYAGNEYWFIASSPGVPNGATFEAESQDLFRVRLTLPANLSGASPGDIGVEVLAKESLLGTPLQTSPAGVYGLAVGREVAPGLRRLYFATMDGQIAVATPVP